MIPLDFFTIQTPSLLFPTVGLLMLAYTNRFLGINTVIRKLHDDMEKDEANHEFYFAQIQSLSKRTKLIINAQKTGMLSMILCVFSMITIFASLILSVIIFTIALALIFISLIIIFRELTLSREVLEYILEDCMKINEARLKKK
jgi:cell division protein FtsL